MQTMNVDVVVPDWVTKIAVDVSGRAWGYENEPTTFNGKYWNVDDGRAIMLYEGNPPKNFKDELYTWDWV